MSKQEFYERCMSKIYCMATVHMVDGKNYTGTIIPRAGKPENADLGLFDVSVIAFKDGEMHTKNHKLSHDKVESIEKFRGSI